MSSVVVCGNVVGDPELRFTPNGVASLKLTVAENKKGKDGEEVAHFYDVTCWKKLAENVSETITKGTRVIVSGQLEQQKWEDKESGDKRSKVSIVAWNIGPDLSWATAVVTKNPRDDQ